MFLLRKRLITVLLCLLCAITLLFGILGLNNKTSQAFTETQGGALGTLYNHNSKLFDGNTLNAIAKAAGGYSDIDELITDITKNDKEIKGNIFGTNTLYFGTNGNTGAALEWTPVYVSKDDNGNAILTLWLSYSATTGNQEVSTWSDGTSNNSATQSWRENGETYTIRSNTYDGSYIRNYVINGRTTYTTAWGAGTAITPPTTGMDKFTEFTNGDLAQYIVTPSYVSWQMAEASNRNDPSFSDSENSYFPDNWTNDLLWLPSLTETGTNGANGIWGTASAQCTNTTDTWLRSGHYSNYVYSFYMTAAGRSAGRDITDTRGVRPALHLNLNLAASYAANPIDPQDVSATYNGGNLTIADVAAADKSWYDSTQVTLSYFSDINCTVSATPKNAGDYYIKVELKSGYTFTDDEATARGWKAVKFTINKKKITVTLSDSDGDGVPDTVTPNSAQICSGDSPPNFKIIYGSAKDTGTTTVPTAAGDYYATAQIADTVCNYEIDTSSTYYVKFTVKTSVNKPYFTSGGAGTVTDSATDTGSAVEFPLSDMTDNVKITTVNGVTYDSANKKLVVSGGVGTYTITVALADTNTMQWSGGGTDSFTLTITIEEPDDPDDGDDGNDPNDPNNPDSGDDGDDGNDPNDPNNPNNPDGGDDGDDGNDPNDPNNPNNPDGGDDGDDGNDPNDPNNPTNPDGGDDGNDPNDPNDPNNPTNPDGGDDGDDGNDPNDPNNPDDSDDGNDPNDPNNPNNPDDSDDGNDPNDPNNPTNPDDGNDNPNGSEDDGSTTVSKGSATGCNKVNWLMIVCICLTLVVIVYYILILRIIHKRREEAEEEEEEYNGDEDDEEE